MADQEQLIFPVIGAVFNHRSISLIFMHIAKFTQQQPGGNWIEPENDVVYPPSSGRWNDGVPHVPARGG